MGDLSDLAGRATDADGLTDHLNVEAASLGLTQVASGVLECPGLLFHVGEGRPGRIVVHDWNVDKCDQTKDHEEGPDDVEVRYNTIAEACHRILTFLKEEIEEGLIRARLAVSKLQISFLKTRRVTFQCICIGESLSLFFICSSLRLSPSVALETASGDSNNGVEEGQADLDLQVVKGMHRAHHLLCIDDFFSFHPSCDK